MSNAINKQHRPIRSFVRREGRITAGQQRALDQQVPLLGVSLADGKLDFRLLFGDENPVVCEIGFGNGQSLADMAEAAPDSNFLGIEVYQPGVGSLLVQVQQRALNNIRVSLDDAVMVFEQQLSLGSLSRVQIFFPDPWQKKRHIKRRLINRGFLDTLSRVLTSKGELHIATDWEPYADEVLELLNTHSSFENTAKAYAARPNWRPLTKYEARGERLGHQVRDILFVRT
ncbi:MAG: tRNA (guanosine(46)-N7)-methyltransferase TrmB [Arenicellaceae bacterium]|nr:tRNA (guanosine(46)-N7)-methyltransferase TrmB [Arenicellaceae bacterium]